MMRKFFTVLLFVGILMPSLAIHAREQQPEGHKQTFAITGYYSPLPTQEFFLTGSYTSEIRLNGRGTHGADGTPVYPGMIAGPRGISFGTKICIAGFGCGTVHERGQAIVKKGDRDLATHDRLDLWMGYGGEGLLRALAWGLQRVESEVYAPGSPIEDSVTFEIPLPLAQILDLPRKQNFAKNLARLSHGESVEILQNTLSRLGFYEGEIDGFFDYDLEGTVFRFQKKYLIVTDKFETGAGVLGPKTRRKLAEELHHFEVQQRIREVWEQFYFEKNLRRGLRNTAVLRLQQILVQHEFMDVSPTGYFGPKTEAALLEFQKFYGIVYDKNTAGAGLVGPLTREKLNEILVAGKSKISAERTELFAYEKSQQRLTMLAGKLSGGSFAMKR